MAELVYQTWERITGRPWSDAAAGGFTTGSYADNIALQQKLLGGWNPYAPAPTPSAPAPPPPAPTPPPPAPAAAVAAAKAAAAGPGPVPVDPGLAAQQWEAMISLQEQIAEQLADLEQQRIEIEERRAADARILQEAQLAANPADFVAYELYKRAVQEQGFEPTRAPRSDVEIQNLFGLALGLEEGGAVEGTGRFGVDIPQTGEISRQEFGTFSPSDIGILSSFLKGGVETGPDTYQGIDPAGYFQELEEGFIPTIGTGRTQVRL